MATIPNGYGENMPDEVTIRLTYDFNGELIHCQAPSAEVLAGSDPLAKIATVYTEAKFQGVCVSRELPNTEKFNTLSREERAFLYMDVGRWGGKRGEFGLAGEREHREFGVVCGSHAVLCKFVNRSGSAPACMGSDDSAYLIHDLLKSLGSGKTSVQITKWETLSTSTKQPPMGPPIYVFLGDLHLPIVMVMPESVYLDSNRKGIGAPEPCMGRVMNGFYKPLHTNDTNELYKWYSSYIKGDIFRGGAEDLLSFLTLLEQSPVSKKIHFIQVGDLYDLWIGLGPFFQKVEGPSGKVLLKNTKNPTAKEFVDYWIRRANQCYPGVTTKLKKMGVGHTTFLYGNHDNYLACYSSNLPKRIRSIRERRLYVEHGQWVDSANYDGATSGHAITDEVFAIPDIRSFDPQRRHYYTAAAAIEYINRRDFGIFVMGHTHLPYLTKVQVQVKRRVPAGGIVGPPRDAGVK